jgi:hypothetical protein
MTEGEVYCDRFPQSIARQRLGKHIPTHTPRNDTVEVFSSCLHMDCCYITHAQ